MKYINHEDTTHKIIIIPRYNGVIDSFSLYHELNDKWYIIEDFETEIVNGYLEVTFTYNAKQGNIFVYQVESENKLVSTGKIEVL